MKNDYTFLHVVTEKMNQKGSPLELSLFWTLRVNDGSVFL